MTAQGDELVSPGRELVSQRHEKEAQGAKMTAQRKLGLYEILCMSHVLPEDRLQGSRRSNTACFPTGWTRKRERRANDGEVPVLEQAALLSETWAVA
jgi:hypothetical protein